MLALALVYEIPPLIALIGKAGGADIEAPITLPGAANLVLGIAWFAIQEQPLARLTGDGA